MIMIERVFVFERSTAAASTAAPSTAAPCVRISFVSA